MSFNSESSNERAAVVIEFLKAANNGTDVLSDKHKDILKLLCEQKKFTALEEEENKKLAISPAYGRKLAEEIYSKMNTAFKKKGVDITVKQATFLTALEECKKLLRADSATTTIEQNGTSAYHVLADSATTNAQQNGTSACKVAEQNGTSARKAAEQNETSACRAIVVLRGRLTEDSNKIEYGVSKRVQEITAEFKKRYRLEANSEISPREQGGVEVTLGGSSADLENLKELFRANKLKDILNIPINDIQISNKNLDGENKKYELVRRIYSQADGSLQLASADLSETALHNANLSYANLSYTNLSYTNLSHADLFRATLIDALLHQTDLRQADLRQANLSNVDLKVALIDRTTKLNKNEHQFNTIRILLEIIGTLSELFIKQKVEDKDPPSGNNYSGADLRGATITNVNCSHNDFSGADLRGAKIINTNFSRANCSETNFSRTIFINVNFRGTNLRRVGNVQSARFISCKGLSKNTRRYLKQQEAIIKVNPGQIVDRVIQKIGVLIGWIASQVWQVLPIIAIAVVVFTLGINIYWHRNFINKKIAPTIKQRIETIPQLIKDTGLEMQRTLFPPRPKPGSPKTPPPTRFFPRRVR